jgi:hypothetical protein
MSRRGYLSPASPSQRPGFGAFAKIFFNGANGANGPFGRERDNWFNGRMFVTTHSAGVSPEDTSNREHLNRRLAGQATTRRLEGRKRFARPELALVLMPSFIAPPGIQAAPSARESQRCFAVLCMTALFSLEVARRPQFLRGKMTASFREMRAISRIFPSENPSESDSIALNPSDLPFFEKTVPFFGKRGNSSLRPGSVDGVQCLRRHGRRKIHCVLPRRAGRSA